MSKSPRELRTARAYKRALQDLKDIHPAEFELLYEARLASADEDDQQSSTARPSKHVQDPTNPRACADCGAKWPCRTAQKRISRNKTAAQRRAQEGG